MMTFVEAMAERGWTQEQLDELPDWQWDFFHKGYLEHIGMFLRFGDPDE